MSKQERQPVGKPKVKVSCRVHPDALAAWKRAGGTRISVDLAAAFEAQWMPSGRGFSVSAAADEWMSE